MPLETEIGQPDLETHYGFILAEDDAIKRAFSGILVPDKDGNLSEVPVWFRMPEGERRQTYPFITIDLIGVNPNYKLWRSVFNVDPTNDVVFESPTDMTPGSYIPDITNDPLAYVQEETPDAVAVHLDPHIPMELLYQVTCHARSALHDRYLASRFMTDVVIPRPFWIGVDADATWRRCELLQLTQADTMETTESGSKRIFRKVYTISMEAEVPQSAAYAIPLVSRVHGDIYANESSAREDPEHAYDDPHAVADSNWTVDQ